MNELLKLDSVFTNGEAHDAGLTDYKLNRMVFEGLIKKIDYGLWAQDGLYDKRVYYQKKYSKSVLSATSALIAWGLVERNNMIVELTVPKSSNATGIKKEKNVVVYQVEDKFYDIGLTTTENSSGETLYLYDPERALVDAWRSNKTIKRDRNLALKNYLNSEYYNFNKLLMYVDYFPGTHDLETVLEATSY